MKLGQSQQYHKKRFDSEPVYNEKYLKTEMKSYKGKFNTNSHNDKIPKEFHCLSVDFIVFKTDKNYYPQVFSEEYKCIVKEKQVTKYINEDLEISSNEENSDEDSIFKKTIQ